MQKEKSCGAIICTEENQEVQYLLIQHIKESGGHWDFPKGKVERDETEQETAKREILEETGLNVYLDKKFKEKIEYTNHINKKEKEVIYFLAKIKKQKINIQKEELQDYAWLKYEDAKNKLTHENAKKLLKKAKDYIGEEKSSTTRKIN